MPTVVQHRSGHAHNVLPTSTIAFLSNNAAGNLLAYCFGGNQGVTIFAGTDNNTNTIANATNIAGSAPSGPQRIDYVANSHSGANTVTANFDTTSDIHIHIWEISGCVTSSPLRDTGVVASNATGSVATGGSTSLSGDAVLAFFYDNPTNDSLTADAGYSISEFSNETTGLDSGLSEFKTATANGIQTATVTGNSTHVLSQAIAVFIQAASSGGTQATTTSPYLGIWSKDSVLACGAFDVGIPIRYGLYDDDFVAQFSGTTVGATVTGVTSAPAGIFSKDATLIGAFDA